MRTRYLFMLLVKKALSVGLGDIFFESTGPNWTFLTIIDSSTMAGAGRV